MQVDLQPLLKNSNIVAVAVSGGSDSMALLHYLTTRQKELGITVKALNVEHGIRGEKSISDTNFVKEFCKNNDIPLITYSINCVEYANQNKLSIEEGARKLRYECFFDALNTGKCDLVATAHHMLDNCESVLFNLFRGTGLNGISGIKNYSNKIIRPFLSVQKCEIEKYILDNDIPYVFDESNDNTNYTRNFIRHKVIPEIKKVFPEVEKSIFRFSTIAKEENEYLDALASQYITESAQTVCIKLPIDKILFSRAVMLAFKKRGIEKDWEKVHVEACYSLTTCKNGDKVCLPKGVVAIKEYDKIVIYNEEESLSNSLSCIPFNVGQFDFNGKKILIEKLSNAPNLKSAFYADLDKIPADTVIRRKKNGDIFTKFGGGTKKLNDYLTDVKVPLRIRNGLPILASKNRVLAIFGLAISNDVKVDEKTKSVIKLSFDIEKN